MTPNWDLYHGRRNSWISGFSSVSGCCALVGVVRNSPSHCEDLPESTERPALEIPFSFRRMESEATEIFANWPSSGGSQEVSEISIRSQGFERKRV